MDDRTSYPLIPPFFSHGINLLGAYKLHYQDNDYDSMVWFVLNNCEEIDEYEE